MLMNFVNAHRKGRWLGGNLKDGVRYLAVQFFTLSGADNIKTIANFI